MNVKLVVVQGKPEGKEIPVRTPKFLVGRGTECHLRPNSELISRHHCMFLMDGNHVTLRDLGSTNGTLVNGERIEGDVAVWHEDLVQVGPLGFRIVFDPVPSSAPTELEPTPVETAAQQVPVAEAVVKSSAGSLGASNAKDSEIEQWLVPDKSGGLHDSGSQVFDGDAELLNTKIEFAAGQETHHDLTLPPASDAPDESNGGFVTLESGRKMKIGNAKEKIEKTRDDTSSAAADILRRVMDRRRR